MFKSHILQYLLLKKYKNRKKVNKILLISKENAHKLNKEFGVPFGENGISVSGTRRKYYLCESRKNLSLLKKLEK